MTLKRNVVGPLVTVIVVVVVAVVTIRMRALADRASELEQQVRAYRAVHQRACSMVQTRLSGARAEVGRRGRAAAFDEAFVRGAFLEVFIFADTCVAVPLPTKDVAEGLLESGTVSPDALADGVVALDDAFTAAAAKDWPPPR